MAGRLPVLFRPTKRHQKGATGRVRTGDRANGIRWQCYASAIANLVYIMSQCQCQQSPPAGRRRKAVQSLQCRRTQCQLEFLASLSTSCGLLDLQLHRLVSLLVGQNVSLNQNEMDIIVHQLDHDVHLIMLDSTQLETELDV